MLNKTPKRVPDSSGICTLASGQEQIIASSTTKSGVDSTYSTGPTLGYDENRTNKRYDDENQAVSNKQIVLLIHGIRTYGPWQEMVAENLEGEGVIVKPIRYGYLDVLKFWFPVFTREKAVRRVEREIREAQRRYPNSNISIIAHSFGTYAIGKILQENPDIKVHRLIFCGSVLQADFRWDRLGHQIEDKVVINECGTRDIWPVLAQSISWGYGATGRFGFGTIAVKDRFHYCDHSGYFNAEFVKRFWAPFITNGLIEKPDWDSTRLPSPWWISALGNPGLKYLILLVIVLVGCH